MRYVFSRVGAHRKGRRFVCGRRLLDGGCQRNAAVSHRGHRGQPGHHPAGTAGVHHGGGAGAGVSIQPVAFLVVQEDGVRLLQMDEGSDALSSAIRSVPEVVDRLGSIFKKDKKDGEASEPEA